jgi:CrcB protein
MLKTILYIAFGGAIGSVFRYLTTLFVAKFWSNHFPLATFLTNVVGCFLIGLFIGLLEKFKMVFNHRFLWWIYHFFLIWIGKYCYVSK